MLLEHKVGGLIPYIWCLKSAAAARDGVPALVFAGGGEIGCFPCSKNRAQDLFLN